MKHLMVFITALFVASSAHAGIWDTIKDAITGHTADVIERVTVEDDLAPGFVEASNNFRENDRGQDAAHWVKGRWHCVQVIRDHATVANLMSNYNLISKQV